MIKETIAMLGRRAKDRITGLEGTIVSVGFDLYGCVQATLNPGKFHEGKLSDNYWMDVSRLELLEGDRRMPVPDFDKLAEKPKDYAHGPAEKPPFRQ